jgi:hypothetical protein
MNLGILLLILGIVIALIVNSTVGILLIVLGAIFLLAPHL